MIFFSLFSRPGGSVVCMDEFQGFSSNVLLSNWQKLNNKGEDAQVGMK